MRDGALFTDEPGLQVWQASRRLRYLVACPLRLEAAPGRISLFKIVGIVACRFGLLLEVHGSSARKPGSGFAVMLAILRARSFGRSSRVIFDLLALVRFREFTPSCRFRWKVAGLGVGKLPVAQPRHVLFHVELEGSRWFSLEETVSWCLSLWSRAFGSCPVGSVSALEISLVTFVRTQCLGIVWSCRVPGIACPRCMYIQLSLWQVFESAMLSADWSLYSMSGRLRLFAARALRAKRYLSCFDIGWVSAAVRTELKCCLVLVVLG